MLSVVLIFGSVLLVLSHVHAYLDPTEMQNRLAAGRPILGDLLLQRVFQASAQLKNILGTFNDTGTKMSSWMGSLSNESSVETLNIPGTHDSCACMLPLA